MSDRMQLMGTRVLLRDPYLADALWDFRWATVETAWQEWDAPWENNPIRPIGEFSAEDILRNVQESFLHYAPSPPTPRTYLRVDTREGQPLGWVNSYHHDATAPAVFIGIDICESAYWNQGLGTEALRLWIDYLFTQRELNRIYLGTWSGNIRMQRVAEKCGFTLFSCESKKREWRGTQYDALTYQITLQARSETKGTE